MLAVKDLSKKFDQQTLFKDVHFEVPTGKSHVIVGPSGSGKSVLMKMIAGLITPDSGTIHLGTDQIGMLFQKNALFDSLTVIENLLFPLKEKLGVIGNQAKDRSINMLTAVGLDHAKDLYPDEISGGMQKRLGIARALILNPSLILFDEPTAGLDPITSRVIAQLVLDLKAQSGCTALIVTNDMQRAFQVGDEIYLLAKGRLTHGGTPAQVQQTANEEFRKFVRGIPSKEDSL